MLSDDGETQQPASRTPEWRQLRADALLGRAFRMSGEHLAGIQDQAVELAELTEGDRHVLEAARRVALGLQERQPGNLTRQVVSLMRRALEVGAWTWDD